MCRVDKVEKKTKMKQFFGERVYLGHGEKRKKERRYSENETSSGGGVGGGEGGGWEKTTTIELVQRA